MHTFNPLMVFLRGRVPGVDGSCFSEHRSEPLEEELGYPVDEVRGIEFGRKAQSQVYTTENQRTFRRKEGLPPMLMR